MTSFSIEHLCHQLATWPKKTLLTDELKQYYRYYGFNLNTVSDIKSGYVHSDDLKIASQLFLPKQPAACHLLILHGYLDHSGTYGNLVSELLTQQCAVALYDMPGHGLSTGPKAEIDDFGCYLKVLERMLDRLAEIDYTPDAVLAHSTGAVAILLGLLSEKLPVLEKMKVVLVAPLVRIANWYRIKFAHFLIKRWLVEVKAGRIDNSSDVDFLELLYNDPLRHDMVPIKWIEAAFAYDQTLKNYSSSNKALTVIQGTADTTVDWRYNLRFLRRKFSEARIYSIEGAKHHVLNEEQHLRTHARTILYERLGLNLGLKEQE